MDLFQRRKRHKSETNCKKCQLFANTPSTPKCAGFPTSTDDCIPTSLALYLSSQLSNFSGSSRLQNCDECAPNLKNPFYSSCAAPCSTPLFSRVPYCSCFLLPNSSTSSSSSLSEEKSNLRLSISSSSDDDMNASSPDSGFESTSSNVSSDYFENLKPDESIDDSSKSSSSSSIPPALPRLCLKPTPKPEIPTILKESPPVISCQWNDCALTFSSYSALHEHLCTSHVSNPGKRICCLWDKCRVYNKEARNIEWLQTHIAVHTRKKRFKCILDGCEATFSSQHGLARHVPSHFSEVNLPKARIAGNTERKCLVKRRRIKDKKKALANIHDIMDQRSVDLIASSLVKYTQPSTSNMLIRNHNQVLCKRYCKDGKVWNLPNSNQKWSNDSSTADPLHDGVLFFARPTKRSRKFKAVK